MFDKILIANRGEIACRIIHTARRLGVATVAVYSDADIDSLHVQLADEAHRIGEAEAEKSYLNIAAIIAAAKASGAVAIHPGYGFLAENPSFACACSDAGLTFIGPPAAAMAAMGAKREAKSIMVEAGIPVVPGFQGDDQNDAELGKAAASIGYPVLIKASAGGGGKGMRIIWQEGELKEALAGARREAKAAFGNADLLLEKYLPNCRHVEIQVFADKHGNALHLFERDCSIQRRHQKVFEEAPAPFLPDELRRQMSRGAVAAIRAIDYVGAGTVEFLVNGDDFFFNEMNTRLQVEHPVTEMVTGLDLVEWQLRVAAGEPLPWRQDDLLACGHAIEARIYAEDPQRDFLPVAGRLTHLHLPRTSADVRIDCGLREGDAVSRHYDPLLGKLIVRGKNRADAVRLLRCSLSEVQLAGVGTNLDFLGRVVASDDFAAGRIDTGFIDAHRDELLQPPHPPDTVFALATLGLLLQQMAEAKEQASASSDPWSPWALAGGWRANCNCSKSFTYRHEQQETTVTARHGDGPYFLELPGLSVVASGHFEDGRTLAATLDNRQLSCALVVEDQNVTVFHAGRGWELSLQDPFSPPEETAIEGGTLSAPMPGRVLEVRVKAGEQVSQGMPLVILEAMKMEHTITAPGDGTVRRVNVGEGDLVDEGDELLVVEAEKGT